MQPINHAAINLAGFFSIQEREEALEIVGSFNSLYNSPAESEPPKKKFRGHSIQKSEIQLLEACKNANWEEAKILLHKGVNPNSLKGEAFLYAIKNKASEVVKLFKSKGARIKISTLHLVRLGCSIEFLLHHFKFDTNALNTLLYFSINFKNQFLIEKLLRLGANPNAFNGTLIKEAFENDDSSILELLYQFGGLPLEANSTSVVIARNFSYEKVFVINELFLKRAKENESYSI